MIVNDTSLLEGLDGGQNETYGYPLSNNTFNNITSWQENFRDLSRFWVQRVLVPIVVIVGVLGNSVTIYILTRRPMRSSTNVYLCALAISDMLFLLFTFTMSLSHYPGIDYSWQYWSYRPFGLWLNDASSSTSVWLTVSFTVERYIAVCHPMRGKVLCTEERAIKVAAIVYAVCFAVTAPTPFEWMLKNETNVNNETVYSLEYSDFGKNDTYTKFFYWFSSISFVLLPVVILGILNFILIQAVRKSRTIRKTMTQNQKTSSARQMQTMRQENRITITLIGVVIVFLICQLPTALVLIYSSFHPNLPKNENALLRAFGNIFNLLVALNAACNFLLYTALSDKYRKYFCAFIFCWKRRGGRGNGAGATLCEPTHAYEMDTMNTTIGLSRAVSLRMEVSPSAATPDGYLNMSGAGSSSSNAGASSYGLRRAQTCHPKPATTRPLLNQQKINSKNNLSTSYITAGGGAGATESGQPTLSSLENNSGRDNAADAGAKHIRGRHKSNSAGPWTGLTSSSGTRGIHINMQDASIPLIQVDQV